jgi:hypothetical protein
MRKAPPLQKRDEPFGSSRSWAEIAPLAWLSFVCFALSWPAVLLLRYALGLNVLFFLLAVVPLALSAATFLFGVLRSIAIYRGKHAGGTLELRGPPVVFAGVMIAAFYFQQHAANFPLTVYVHGSASQQSLPLRNEGVVLLDLDGDRRREPIGDKGQAFFQEIPANFRGQKVNVALDASGYERTDNSRLELDGTSVYVEVRRKPSHIEGNVIDETGKPVVGATVSMAGISTTSREQGHFDLVVPSARVLDRMVLRVSADGYQPWSEMVIPNGGPVTEVLRR